MHAITGRTSILTAALLTMFGACTPHAAPTATEVIDRMLAAFGSERARDNVRSLRTVAEGNGPSGLFVTTVTSIRPDTVHFHRQTGLGATEIWSTPERTWGGANQEAFAELAPTLRGFVRGHEFHLLLLDMPARFSDFSMQGPDQVGDSPCLRISMTDETGAGASVCIRESDWLPVELQLSPAGADGSIRIEFADWQVVAGVNWFHAFRMTEGDDEFTYEFVEISAGSFGQEVEIAPPVLPQRETNES